MANRYWVGGNGSWDDTAGSKWSTTSGGSGGSAVPTASDAVFLDNGTGHGNVTIATAASAAALSLNCTSYTGTLTFNQNLTVVGAVTFVAGQATMAGSSTLICNATATLTSGGKTIPGGLQLGGTSQTYTMSGAWVVTGVLTLSGTTAITVNSSTISVAGGLTVTTGTSGTCVITMTGGNWTGAAILKNSLTFAGNVTLLSGTNNYSTGTLTYTSGTITVTGNTLSMALATTLNTNGLTWNNILITAAVTITLSSALQAADFNTSASGTTTIAGGQVITTTTMSNSNVGTTTWGLSAAVTASGLWTIAGAWTQTGAFDVTAGSCTITTTNNVTMIRDVTINGLTTRNSAGNFNGAYNWKTNGLTNSAALGGTGTIKFSGTGTWTGGGNINLNVAIVAGAGTLTLSGTIAVSQSGTPITLTYTSGTISAGLSVLSVLSNCTLNCNGMTWFGVSVAAGNPTITLSSALQISGTLTTATTALTFSGSYAITTVHMTNNGAATTLNLSGTITCSGVWTIACATSWTQSGAFNITADSCNITGAATITLIRDIFITNTTTTSAICVINGAFNWNTGGLNTGFKTSGTATILFNGTGTWTGGAGSLWMNAEINTAGTLTLSGTILFAAGGTPVLAYTAGTVSPGTSVLSIGGSCSITKIGVGFSLYSLTITAAVTLTLSAVGGQALCVAGTLTMPDAAVTFSGSVDITIGTFSNTVLTAARTYTFVVGQTYTITGAFNLSGRSSGVGTQYVLTLIAGDGTGSTAAFVLGPGATQDVGFVTANKLASLAGQAVFNYKGTLTATTNWVNTYPVNAALVDPSYQTGM